MPVQNVVLRLLFLLFTLPWETSQQCSKGNHTVIQSEICQAGLSAAKTAMYKNVLQPLHSLEYLGKTSQK